MQSFIIHNVSNLTLINAGGAQSSSSPLSILKLKLKNGQAGPSGDTQDQAGPRRGQVGTGPNRAKWVKTEPNGAKQDQTRLIFLLAGIF